MANISVLRTGDFKMRRTILVVILIVFTAVAISVAKVYAWNTSWVYVQARLQNPAQRHFNRYVLGNLKTHHLARDGKLKDFTVYVYDGHRYDPSKLLYKRKVRENRTDTNFTLKTGKVYFFVVEMQPGRAIYSGGESYRVRDAWQQWLTVSVPNYR